MRKICFSFYKPRQIMRDQVAGANADMLLTMIFADKLKHNQCVFSVRFLLGPLDM